MLLPTPLAIIFGLAALVLGGHWLVKGASRLSAILGISPMVIGLTVVAFGTSTPELAVSLAAALRGNADIAVANVVGSNILNVFFILGLCALLKPLLIHSQMIKREVPLMIIISIVMALMALNGTISRWEGALLFSLIILYTGWLVKEARSHKKENKELERESEEAYGALQKSKTSLGLSVLWILVGLGLVMLGADWLVDGAIALAKSLGVSDAVIGVTIVAAGTSLPEVVASLMATAKGERDIAVGNVVGSNIYNVLAILGASSMLIPSGLNVSEALLRFDIPVMILAAVLCWPLFRTGRTLSRWEGGLFLGLYSAFTVYLVSMAS